MAKGLERTPRRYEGTAPTGRPIADLLPLVMSQIGSAYQERGDLILAAWPAVIGERHAPMTQAVAFVGGVLTVRVRNSTLYSLLVQHERSRLLKALRTQFPQTAIHNIVFRMG